MNAIENRKSKIENREYFKSPAMRRLDRLLMERDGVGLREWVRTHHRLGVSSYRMHRLLKGHFPGEETVPSAANIRNFIHRFCAKEEG